MRFYMVVFDSILTYQKVQFCYIFLYVLERVSKTMLKAYIFHSCFIITLMNLEYCVYVNFFLICNFNFKKYGIICWNKNINYRKRKRKHLLSNAQNLNGKLRKKYIIIATRLFLFNTSYSLINPLKFEFNIRIVKE